MSFQAFVRSRIDRIRDEVITVLMNAKYPLTLILLLFINSLCLGDPPKVQAVLLDDLSVVEGRVERINNFVRISPANGPAKLVLAKQIEFLGDSTDAVYRFVLDKADTSTASGLVKLATWCEKAGMGERATVHAKAAAAVAPQDATVRELLARLAKNPDKKSNLKLASATVPIAVPNVVLSSESAVFFNLKIQPVLMNKCGSCHTQKTYTGPFKLERVLEGYSNPESTAENLKITATQLNRENPAQSHLLLYSLVAHGGQKIPAFSNRELPGFQNLEVWVRASVPGVKNSAVPSPIAEPNLLPVSVVGTSSPRKALDAEPKPIAPTTPPQHVLSAGPATPPTATPTTKQPVAAPSSSQDPFDPAKFNSLPRRKEH
jgi:hypothetical protein